MAKRVRKEVPVSVRAAALAQQIAFEMGLPAGCLWVAGAARSFLSQWRREGYSEQPDGWLALERDNRVMLGLVRPN